MKQRILFFVLYMVVVHSINAQQLFTEQTLKFGRVMALVEAFYVDSTNQEELTEKAIIEVLHNLDPHSVYVSSDEVKEMNEGLEGNFEGIGIQFNMLYDSIIVIAPIPGGPSEKAGLRAGDRIVIIDGENVAGMGITTNGVRKRLLGDKGTRVNVGIYRRGVKDILDYTIIRDKIPVHSLDAAYMVADKVGFVKLNRCSATSEKEFFEAISKLKDRNMEHLIVDLRGNTGGYLEAAIRLTDQFFESERLIVYLKGLNTSRQDFKSRKGGILTDAR
ncbi:MAG: PDZ domain-containing protein, partial [Bacteroidales bacterium]|nr:PDZ domain-containing protein [Bacteroidales bacterium]